MVDFWIFWIMRSKIDILNFFILFVDYYTVGYNKHQKTFSKKCVMKIDFFVYTKH